MSKPFLYGLHSSRFPLPAMESTCGRRTRRKLMKIVGGTVATIESHPWVATIFWHSKSKESVFRCAGSLISSCWVLTAAHCFPDGYEVIPHTVLHCIVLFNKLVFQLPQQEPPLHRRSGEECPQRERLDNGANIQGEKNHPP